MGRGEAWLGAGLSVLGGAAALRVAIPHPSFLCCVPKEEFGFSLQLQGGPMGRMAAEPGSPPCIPPQGWILVQG